MTHGPHVRGDTPDAARSEDRRLLHTARADDRSGDQSGALDGLPSDVAGLAAVTHGLYLHEHIAPAYGVTLSDERRAEVHVRRLRDRLAAILARDASPLTDPRPVAERMISDCRHSTVTVVSMLRRQGVPARARCGFGSYFEPGKFGDHWVCEYYDDGRRPLDSRRRPAR